MRGDGGWFFTRGGGEPFFVLGAAKKRFYRRDRGENLGLIPPRRHGDTEKIYTLFFSGPPWLYGEASFSFADSNLSPRKALRYTKKSGEPPGFRLGWRGIRRRAGPCRAGYR